LKKKVFEGKNAIKMGNQGNKSLIIPIKPCLAT
jgi:hypothetical protein